LRLLLRRCVATSARCVSTRQSVPLRCAALRCAALRCAALRCAAPPRPAPPRPALSCAQSLLPKLCCRTVRCAHSDCSPVCASSQSVCYQCSFRWLGESQCVGPLSVVGGGAAAVRNANAAAAAARHRVTDDDCANGRFRDEVKTGHGHLLYHDGARESTESHWKSTNGLPSLLRATLVRWCISNLAGPHLH
jgi:hypothetical protein